jgi:transposase-like protein
MKKATSNKPTLIPQMYCNLFGHDYQVSKKVTYHVKEYTCSHCKKELTTNSNGLLTELTPKFREINAILERIHNARMNRLKDKMSVSSIY